MPRIDVLSELRGVTCAEAWPARPRAPFGPIDVDYLGRDHFVRNRRATGRARDRADLEELG